MQRIVIRRIPLLRRRRRSNRHLIRIRLLLHYTEVRADFVVTLGSPRDVVDVRELVGKEMRCEGREWMKGTHGVDVQDRDVGGRHEEILDERGDHMPRFELRE